MAKLLILTHEHDCFAQRRFILEGLFEHWRARGHDVVVHAGPDGLPPADVVILHVDGSVVPPAYVDAVKGYPVVLNRRPVDIRKRAFSGHLLREGEAWDGPVIVKTDRNSGGVPEAFHAKVAAATGRGPGPPVRFMRERYPVYPSARAVPKATWRDPDLVVEKFLPERDERGYYLRTWIFLGDAERCTRTLGPHPVVKGGDTLDRSSCDVPDALRVWRTRMGFDYGKFDFTIHQGAPILFDVNRTPTRPARLTTIIDAGAALLAEGIDGFLRGRAVNEP